MLILRKSALSRIKKGTLPLGKGHLFASSKKLDEPWPPWHTGSYAPYKHFDITAALRRLVTSSGIVGCQAQLRLTK